MLPDIGNIIDHVLGFPFKHKLVHLLHNGPISAELTVVCQNVVWCDEGVGLKTLVKIVIQILLSSPKLPDL